MSIRPIEPGCLVVILMANSPDLVGKCGTVLGRSSGEIVTPAGRTIDVSGWWYLDVPGEELLCCRPASSLLRIDDHEEDEGDYAVVREEWGLTA